MFWIDAEIGFFAMAVIAIIAYRMWREARPPKDMRRTSAKYDRAERKARRRSFWKGTDYEAERAKAMKEAFPGE